MCKEDWCVGLGQEGDICVRVGVTVLNTLKGGGIEKRGRKTKIFNGGGGGGQAVSRGGFLKRGAGTPLRTMIIDIVFKMGLNTPVAQPVSF